MSEDPEAPRPAGSEVLGGCFCWAERLELGGGDGAAEDEPEASGCGRGRPAATLQAGLWGLN